MAVPKNRHTKSRRNTKRSHIGLSTMQLSSCPKCGKPVRSHMLCENCGTYKKREHVDVLAKLDKREKKQKSKELKEQESTTQEEVNTEGLPQSS